LSQQNFCQPDNRSNRQQIVTGKNTSHSDYVNMIRDFKPEPHGLAPVYSANIKARSFCPVELFRLTPVPQQVRFSCKKLQDAYQE